MFTVTVSGAHGRITTLSFDNAALAEQIAGQIASNMASFKAGLRTLPV